METKNFIIVLIIILILVGGFVFLDNKDSNLNEGISNGDYDKVFEVRAFKFDYEPNEIRVEQGDKVLININNLDGLHGMRIPDLEISGNEQIRFIADEKGEFSWSCNNYCGKGHHSMNGRLIVS